MAWWSTWPSARAAPGPRQSRPRCRGAASSRLPQDLPDRGVCHHSAAGADARTAAEDYPRRDAEPAIDDAAQRHGLPRLDAALNPLPERYLFEMRRVSIATASRAPPRTPWKQSGTRHHPRRSGDAAGGARRRLIDGPAGMPSRPAVLKPPPAAGALMRTETFHEAREYQRKPPAVADGTVPSNTGPRRRFLTTATRLTDPTASCLAAVTKTGWAADEEEPHPSRGPRCSRATGLDSVPVQGLQD